MARLIQSGVVPGNTSSSVTVPIPDFTQDITAIATVPAGTKGNFDTLDYTTGITTGQRFNFVVPEDYQAGTDLVLKATCAMSSSVAATIKVNAYADIADITVGTIDTATYASGAGSDITVPADTTITRVDLLTINSGDFDTGDMIQFFVVRLGGSDSHGGNWKVLTFGLTYTAFRNPG